MAAARDRVVLPGYLAELKRLARAARLRMTGMGRTYRHLRLTLSLGRPPTPVEMAADAAELDALLTKANRLDPAGAVDTWKDALCIVSAYNLCRGPDDPPI